MLQIFPYFLNKAAIISGKTNKAAVVFKGFFIQIAGVGNKVLRYACAPEEFFGYIAL